MKNDLLNFIWSVFGPYIGQFIIGAVIILGITLLTIITIKKLKK